MSNKSILEWLLVETDEYVRNRTDRNIFAERVRDSIEALEGVPYSVRQHCGDWQYKIETEGYFDEEGFESEIEEVIPQLKDWINGLIEDYGQ